MSPFSYRKSWNIALKEFYKSIYKSFIRSRAKFVMKLLIFSSILRQPFLYSQINFASTHIVYLNRKVIKICFNFDIFTYISKTTFQRNKSHSYILVWRSVKVTGFLFTFYFWKKYYFFLFFFFIKKMKGKKKAYGHGLWSSYQHWKVHFVF